MTSAATVTTRQEIADSARDLQVSGLANFPESRWREAILFYLFGVWGNRHDVIFRPKLAFGEITLRLNRLTGNYYAYGHQEVREDIPPIDNDDLVETSGEKNAVEVSLIRFVKNERIRQLRLRFPSVSGDTCTLVLWKKDKRGEYGVAGLGLPYDWGTKGPIWTLDEYRTGNWWK